MILREHFTQAEILAAIQRWGSGDHHEMGPSSLWRCVCCNASALAGAICKDADNSNEHAEKGTRIHKAIEDWIKEKVEPDSDTEEAQHLEVAKAALGESNWESEVSLGVILYSGILYFGTADAVRIGKRTASIIDWKTTPVAELSEESHKLQLGHLAYALMSMYIGIEQVAAKAVYTDTGRESETMFFRREELADYIESIKDLSAKCQSPEAEFAQCSGSYCKYCRVAAANLCPTKAREILEASMALEVTIPETTALMTVEHADSALLKCKIVSDRVEQIEKQAKESIRQNGGSEHFKVDVRRGCRKTDWEGLCRHAFSLLGQEVPQEAIEKFTTTAEPTTQIRERRKK